MIIKRLLKKSSAIILTVAVLMSSVATQNVKAAVHYSWSVQNDKYPIHGMYFKTVTIDYGTMGKEKIYYLPITDTIYEENGKLYSKTKEGYVSQLAYLNKTPKRIQSAAVSLNGGVKQYGYSASAASRLGYSIEDTMEGPFFRFHIAIEVDWDASYKMLDLVNAERQKKGLDLYYMNEYALKIATQRAFQCMVYFAHISPAMQECGVAASGIVNGVPLGVGKGTRENIALGGESATAQSLFDGYMNSPGHKANILCKEMTPKEGAIGTVTARAVGQTADYGKTVNVQCFYTDNSTSGGARAEATRKNGKEVMTDVVEVLPKAVADGYFDLGLYEKQKTRILEVGDQLIEYPTIFTPDKYNAMDRTNYGADETIVLQPSDFDWSGSKKNVGTVTSNGVIKAKKTGTFTLTAKVKDSNSSYGILKKKVQVVKKSSVKSVKVKKTGKKGRKFTITPSLDKKMKYYEVQYKKPGSKKWTTVKKLSNTFWGNTLCKSSKKAVIKVASAKKGTWKFRIRASGYGMSNKYSSEEHFNWSKVKSVKVK